MYLKNVSRLVWVFWVGFLGVQAWAQQAILDSLPQLPTSAQVLVDPAGFFSATISPAYFRCAASPRNIQCNGVLSVGAQMSIQVKDVPATATVALVALNNLEQYENQTQFRVLSSTKTAIDQVPAIVQTFTYNELNNVERPVWVQVLSAVQATKLVTLQVQCRSAACAEYGVAINQVIKTLQLAPLDSTGMPIKGRLKTQSSGPTLNSVIQQLEF